jgi:adenylate cyclase class 2
MYEIELKAHVRDYEAVRLAINGFADYRGFAYKHDIYWHLVPSVGTARGVTVRIRTQDFTVPDGTSTTRHIVTYKRKELRASGVPGGAAIEVNDEKEFTVDDSEPLTVLLQDMGFTVKLTKNKAVHTWKHGRAGIELCTVDPLGDFLEIEIISESNDDEHVTRARAEIEALLLKSGVRLSDIEERYYSDLLKAQS